MNVEIRSRLGISAAVILTALLLITFALGSHAAQSLTRENGPIESLSALSYLAGLLLCGYFVFSTPQPARWHLAFWALLCLVFFGEETSWLQHQIGYATPEWVAGRNAQREFNLHNLSPLQGGALLGGERPGWEALAKSQNLFQLGFVAYFLLLPVLRFIPIAGRWIARLQVPYPGSNLLLTIWIPLAASAVLTLLSSAETKSAVAETRELIYALSILAFIGCYTRQLSQR